MTVNDELIVQTLAAIERDPARHNQHRWVVQNECGTTCCFAGHAVLTVSKLRLVSGTEHWFWMPDGSEKHVADAAAELLGLPEARNKLGETCADRLFFDCDTLDDLYAECADILGVDEVVLRDKVHAVAFPDRPL